MSISDLDPQPPAHHSVIREKTYSLALLIFSGYLLLWVAIFNGYPVFYPDSGHYLGVSFYWQPPVYRTITYSIFIRLASLGASPWLVVIAQSVLAIFLLRSLFKFILRQTRPIARESLVFLGLIASLAAATTLPWYIGQIMPDAFTGLTLLSLFLLLYDSKMSVERTVLISAILCISVAVHLTHLLAFLLLLLLIFTVRLSGKLRDFWPSRSTIGILAFILLPIMAMTSLLALSNWNAGYGFSLSPGRPLFLLGRLFESGLAENYLQQHCGAENYTPCKYLHNLPKSTEEFLWGSHPLLKEMGGYEGATKEANRLVSAIIWDKPVKFAVECATQMFRQFLAFAPGSGNYALRQGVETDGFLLLYPGDVQKYLASRQSIGKLAMDAFLLKPLYAVVFWASLAVGLLALFTNRLKNKMANQLFVVTLIFLFANALTTAALSTVNDRYQARAVWLTPLSSAAYFIPYFLQRRRPDSKAA